MVRFSNETFILNSLLIEQRRPALLTPRAKIRGDLGLRVFVCLKEYFVANLALSTDATRKPVLGSQRYEFALNVIAWLAVGALFVHEVIVGQSNLFDFRIFGWLL